MQENGWFTLMLPAFFMVFIAVLAWVMARKRSVQQHGNGMLRLLQVMPMGQRERLVVVSLSGETLLLGVTTQQIQLLHARPASSNNNEIGTKMQK